MGLDATNPDGGEQQQEVEAAPPAEQSKADEIAANHLKALQKERDKRQALEQRLKEIEEAKVEEARKAAESTGKYEDLYKAETKRAKDLASRIAEFEAREAERDAKATEAADAIVAKWQDGDKVLDPVGLPAESRLEKVRALDARLNAVSAKPAGTRSTGGAKVGDYIPPECESLAKRIGRDPKEFFPIWLSTTAGKEWKSKQGSTD